VATGVLEAGLESAGETGEDRARPDFQPGLRVEDGWDSVGVQGFQAEIHSGVVEIGIPRLIHCFRLAADAVTDSAARHEAHQSVVAADSANSKRKGSSPQVIVALQLMLPLSARRTAPLLNDRISVSLHSPLKQLL
jgi:hypothetical protein